MKNGLISPEPGTPRHETIRKHVFLQKKKNSRRSLLWQKKNPQNRHSFSGPMLSPQQPFKRGFLLTMTRKFYGTSGVGIHVGRGRMGGASSRASKPTLGGLKPPNLSRFLGLTHSTTNSNWDLAVSLSMNSQIRVKLGPEPNTATNPRNPNMECSTFSFRTNSRFRPYPRTSELSLTPQFWSLCLGFRPNFGGRPLTLSLDFNLKPLKPWVWHDTPNPKATELKTMNSDNVTQFQSHVAENTILGDTLPKNKNMGCRSVIQYVDA